MYKATYPYSRNWLYCCEDCFLYCIVNRAHVLGTSIMHSFLPRPKAFLSMEWAGTSCFHRRTNAPVRGERQDENKRPLWVDSITPFHVAHRRHATNVFWYPWRKSAQFWPLRSSGEDQLRIIRCIPEGIRHCKRKRDGGTSSACPKGRCATSNEPPMRGR